MGFLREMRASIAAGLRLAASIRRHLGRVNADRRRPTSADRKQCLGSATTRSHLMPRQSISNSRPCTGGRLKCQVKPADRRSAPRRSRRPGTGTGRARCRLASRWCRPSRSRAGPSRRSISPRTNCAFSRMASATRVSGAHRALDVFGAAFPRFAAAGYGEGGCRAFGRNGKAKGMERRRGRRRDLGAHIAAGDGVVAIVQQAPLPQRRHVGLVESAEAGIA